MDQEQQNCAWQMVKELGSGGFGKVVLFRNLRTDEAIATKWLRQNHTLSDDQAAKLKERWLYEFKLTKDLNTKFIVRGMQLNDKAFVASLNAKHEWKPLPVIVMEYCNGGDVRALLQRSQNCNGLHEYEVRDILHALRYAVEYLHNVCGIKHRDLKPDNVLIHQSGGKRCYKLADFGFARELSEHTMQQSMVGTRHYVAPEVVDSSQYTRTVDYWSVGVIAFELMCGCLPFIPHSDMYNIIVNIKKKPQSCVAICEDLIEPGRVYHQNHVHPQTRMSVIFRQRMEEWLRLVLDTDFRKRGGCAEAAKRENRQVEFYTLLDDILACKVLRIFCLNTNSFHDYELVAGMTMEQLKLTIGKDTQLSPFEFILPVGHPLQAVTPQTQPLDLYVPEWQNTGSSENSLAMVYVVNAQCDYTNDECTALSEPIKLCMKLTSMPDKKTQWRRQEFERHIHFLLSDEQRHLSALLNGLGEYAKMIEHELLELEPLVETLVHNSAFIFGRIQQFHKQFSETLLANGEGIPHQWLDGLCFHFCVTLSKRHKSALRRAKEQATNPQFASWIAMDMYRVTPFRTSLGAKQHSLQSCQDAINHGLMQRYKFFKEATFRRPRDAIADIAKEYHSIRIDICSAQSQLMAQQEHLDQLTRDFQTSLQSTSINASDLMEDGMSQLQIDDDESRNVIQVNKRWCEKLTKMW